MAHDCMKASGAVADNQDKLLAIAPFALLECTCEPQPRVLRASDQAFRLLGADCKSGDWSSFFSENLLLLPAFDERAPFRSLVDRALQSYTTREFGVRLLGYEGESVPVHGWLRALRNKGGGDRLLFSFLPQEDGEARRRFASMTLDALKASYNVIFEVDLARNMAECVYGKDTSDIGSFFGVRMAIPSAKSFWLDNYVHKQDRAVVSEYVDVVCSERVFEQREEPLQLEFRVDWRDGHTYSFVSAAVVLSETMVLVGFRNISSLHFKGLTSASERTFNRVFASAQDLIEGDVGALGLLRFHLCDNKVVFHYWSPHLAELLGVPKGDLVRVLNAGMDKQEFERRIRRFGIGLESLLEQGDCVVSDGRKKKAKALRLAARTCLMDDGKRLYSIYAFDPYVKSASDSNKNGILIRTFGCFDVFVRGRAIVFASPKEKELMALLVDRRGGTLCSDEACALLWPECNLDKRVRARYRKLSMNLKNTLEEADCSELLVSRRGVRNIDMDKATCDCYEFFRGNPHFADKYRGAYMLGYQWAQETRSQLDHGREEDWLSS